MPTTARGWLSVWWNAIAITQNVTNQRIRSRAPTTSAGSAASGPHAGSDPPRDLDVEMVVMTAPGCPHDRNHQEQRACRLDVLISRKHIPREFLLNRE
jgi:hypothetical protein